MPYRTLLVALALLSSLPSPPAAPLDAKGAVSIAERDGVHAFDPLFGSWSTHHRRLKEPLSGKNEWLEFDGTAAVRSVLAGAANVADLTWHLPGGDVRALTVAAYDAGSGQWAIWTHDGRTPHAAIDPPSKGQFASGVGTFFGDDVVAGQHVRVRTTWSRLAPGEAHWEQAYSTDGGIVWTTSWTTDFHAAKSEPETRQVSASAAIDTRGVHGFDFERGNWTVHHRVKRTTGEWWESDGSASNAPVLGGSGNVEDNVFMKSNGTTYGVAIRMYDSAADKWAIWWLDSRVPLGPKDPPNVGRFVNGVGTFDSDVILNGVTTSSRFVWSKITPTSAHWEQASSTDGGKTWEPNWIMDFKRKP